MILRNILTKYLNRIEINFRTFLTYHVSNKHQDSPTWFVDPAVVSMPYVQSFDREVYTSKFKLNPAIKHHHKTHINDKYAPAWKTIELMTLGEVIYLQCHQGPKNSKSHQRAFWHTATGCIQELYCCYQNHT